MKPDDQPFFSVVTVCYNAEKTIEQAIKSVQAQRGVSFEHILIDGGSTDGTMEIVGRYAKGMAHITSARDRGVYDAMQKGLLQARGRFTGFLNADDFYASDEVLAKLAEALPGNGFLGVTGMVRQIDINERVKRVVGAKPHDDRELLWGRFPAHPATYLRTDIMRDVGGFDASYKIGGDYDLFLRVRKASQAPLAHVAQPIVIMRVGGVSTGGYASYKLIGDEMLIALAKSGYPVSPFKIRTRFLRKLPELFKAKR